MTQAEHYALNTGAYYALKPVIDANYPRGQFVAIAGGQIVADDADFVRLDEKLTALGFGRMEALVERAGDPIPGQAAFPGMMAVTAMGRALWSSETRTGA